MLLSALKIHQQQSSMNWFAEVFQAFEWMKQFQPLLGPYPADATDVDTMIQLVQTVGISRWKSLCRRSLWQASFARQLLARFDEWQHHWTPHDLPSVGKPSSSLSDVQRAHGCPDCSKWFASAKDLAVHRKLMHRVHAKARYYMPHPQTCQSCLKMFGNTQKLRQHLQSHSVSQSP